MSHTVAVKVQRRVPFIAASLASGESRRIGNARSQASHQCDSFAAGPENAAFAVRFNSGRWQNCRGSSMGTAKLPGLARVQRKVYGPARDDSPCGDVRAARAAVFLTNRPDGSAIFGQIPCLLCSQRLRRSLDLVQFEPHRFHQPLQVLTPLKMSGHLRPSPRPFLAKNLNR